MAKIYETREDLEREQLSQSLSHSVDNMGLAGGVTGLGAGMIAMGLIKKAPAKIAAPEGAGFFKRVWHYMRHEPIHWKTTGAIVAAVGAFGIWNARNNAMHAQEQLDKLGPETVVLPPIQEAPGECAPCKLKAMRQKSLLEYAAKPEGERQVG